MDADDVSGAFLVDGSTLASEQPPSPLLQHAAPMPQALRTSTSTSTIASEQPPSPSLRSRDGVLLRAAPMPRLPPQRTSTIESSASLRQAETASESGARRTESVDTTQTESGGATDAVPSPDSDATPPRAEGPRPPKLAIDEALPEAQTAEEPPSPCHSLDTVNSVASFATAASSPEQTWSPAEQQRPADDARAVSPPPASRQADDAPPAPAQPRQADDARAAAPLDYALFSRNSSVGANTAVNNGTDASPPSRPAAGDRDGAAAPRAVAGGLDGRRLHLDALAPQC